MTAKLVDEIKSNSEYAIAPSPQIPANPAEIPVTVPIDDPEIIVRGEEEYSNSLDALLKKYKPGSRDK
jgi:hypothetical protein